MPVPTSITDLSTTAASNSPAGADAVFPSLDDYLRALSAFIAQLNDGKLALSGGTMTGALTVPMVVASSSLGFRNRIINGAFAINQRGYVSGTATTGANQYTLDRWRVVVSGQSATFSASGNGNQVTAPAGGYEQVIEGANVEGGVYTLSWTGTATAKVNGAAIANGGQTAALPANTDVTIRFSGGTVREVQFEVGSVATAFEQRPRGVELALCQVYTKLLTGINWVFWAESNNTYSLAVSLGVPMRVAPTTITLSAGTPQGGGGTLSFACSAEAIRYQVLTGAATGQRYGFADASVLLDAEL